MRFRLYFVDFWGVTKLQLVEEPQIKFALHFSAKGSGCLEKLTMRALPHRPGGRAADGRIGRAGGGWPAASPRGGGARRRPGGGSPLHPSPTPPLPYPPLPPGVGSQRSGSVLDVQPYKNRSQHLSICGKTVLLLRCIGVGESSG